MSGLYLRATLARRGLDLEFAVEPGEVLAIMGPNGSGKSTALHLIAGLLQPDHGQVRCGQRTLTDTDAGIRVPTHERRIGLLLQKALLFPHMSVAANVGFAATPAAAERWLAEVDAGELAGRKPRALSGGQAQRVAIARALAAEPDALLLDEPMAGLDVATAAAVRAVLRRVLRRDGRCAVMVTHDLLDVLTLADRALVIEDGRVVESGRATDVLATPRSGFGARIAGLNLIRGRAGADGELLSSTGQAWFGVPSEPLPAGSAAVAVFAPTAVSVFAEPPKGSPRNVVEVMVAELDQHGSAIRLRAEPLTAEAPGIAADVTPDAAADLAIAPGARVWFAVKAREVALHPADR